MIHDLLNKCPDIPEHSESGSSLAILSSMGQLQGEDESGFVSTSIALSEYTKSTHSCTKGLGNDISLSENSLLQRGYIKRYQVGPVFRLF